MKAKIFERVCLRLVKLWVAVYISLSIHAKGSLGHILTKDRKILILLKCYTKPGDFSFFLFLLLLVHVKQAGTTCGVFSQPDLIQNHFLIARMLRFLQHSRQKVPYFNISR